MTTIHPDDADLHFVVVKEGVWLLDSSHFDHLAFVGELWSMMPRILGINPDAEGGWLAPSHMQV